MAKTKEDLFGLENDSEEEHVSSDEEEQQDSRFTKFRLKKQDLSNDDSDDSDDSDDDDNAKEESKENEEKSAQPLENKDETKGKDKKKKSTEQLEKKDETNADKGESKAKEGESTQQLEKKDKKKDETESEGEEEESEDELGVEGYDAPKDMTAFGYGKKKIRPDKKIKALTPEELEKFEQARKNTGVCYLSRIPPFMPPRRVRSLLSKHAEIGRIFLVPEDPKTIAKRKKYKKERRTNFIEGWVEFKDKKKAKALAEHLNMREIGGKRTSEYYHEMWNIKYLPKFKWHHLTEHRAQEKKAREQRLRNEIAQSNRENKTYIQNVERAKMLQNMEQKKRKREGDKSKGPAKQKIQRTFTQRGNVVREVDPKISGKQVMENMDIHLKNVLGNIFAKK